MMRTALAYDTETTGLPLFTEPSDDPRQPHIIQLAADLFDIDTRRPIAGFSLLIKPEGWVIPSEIESLTGISTERAAMFGVPIATALPLFLELCSMVTVHRVAHNESFDARILRIAMKRAGIYPDAFMDQWKAAPAYCTCNSSKAIVNLPPTERMVAAKKKGPKAPNLAEAYEFFTGQKLVNAHDAAADVAACKTIFFALQDLQRQQAA